MNTWELEPQSTKSQGKKSTKFTTRNHGSHDKSAPTLHIKSIMKLYCVSLNEKDRSKNLHKTLSATSKSFYKVYKIIYKSI